MKIIKIIVTMEMMMIMIDLAVLSSRRHQSPCHRKRTRDLGTVALFCIVHYLDHS